MIILFLVFACALFASVVAWLVGVLAGHVSVNAAVASILQGAALVFVFWALLTYAIARV